MQKSLIYFIGIKGVGMSALAKIYSQMGFQVEGSDVAENFVTDSILSETNIKVHSPFNAKNLEKKNPELVIISAAYDENNPEVKEAKKQNCKILYYSEALGEISADKTLIAVAGVHGKTTTTAMIATIMQKAGLDPSFIIGAAHVPGLGTNAQFGDSEYFVTEADEYRKSPSNNDSKFLDLNPQIAVITSIELDHPDIFGSVEEIYNAFYKFACRVPRSGTIVLDIDYTKSKKLVSSLVDRHFETYGFSEEATWRIVNENFENNSFELQNKNKIFGPFALKVPGKHNMLNATAAIITAFTLEIELEIIKGALIEFQGVERRFDLIGSEKGITVIDDYAHHPTAIESTLEAVRSKYPNIKIWCIFQPHTFSRTQALLKEFGMAFKKADKVIITDIYTSAREKEGSISGQNLAQEIQKHQKNIYYFNNFEKIEKYVKTFAKGPLIILAVGAGNIYELAKKIVQILKER